VLVMILVVVLKQTYLPIGDFCVHKHMCIKVFFLLFETCFMVVVVVVVVMVFSYDEPHWSIA